jgi:hypothetical protein
LKGKTSLAKEARIHRAGGKVIFDLEYDAKGDKDTDRQRYKKTKGQKGKGTKRQRDRKTKIH